MNAGPTPFSARPYSATPPLKSPPARSQTASFTPTSVRFTIDSMMWSGSMTRWSVSTPLVKKSRSAAASKMPVLPAAEKAKTYSAPASFCARASSLLVAGSLKPVAQPRSSVTPGLTFLAPSSKPTYQRRMNGASTAPTAPIRADSGKPSWSPVARRPKVAPSRYVPSCSLKTMPRTLGLSTVESTMRPVLVGVLAGQPGHGVDRVERVGDDQVVALVDRGLEVVLHGRDVGGFDDLGLDAALRSTLVRPSAMSSRNGFWPIGPVLT